VTVDSVFYDVGANVGAFSGIAGTIIGEKGAVIAFEPSFSTYYALCKNCTLNPSLNSVRPYPVALADANKISFFKYATLAPGQALHEMHDMRTETGRVLPVFTQEVLTYTLDSFIDQFALPFPTHIKIDVDGEEVKVVKGAQKTLRDSRVQHVLIEIDETIEGWRELLQSVLDAGFTVDSRNPRKQPGAFNYIFVRS
jgi:FkbM family methyltransferase